MPGKQRAALCLAPKNMAAADWRRGLPGKRWVQRVFSLFSLLMPLSLFSGQRQEAAEGSRAGKGTQSFLPAPLYPRMVSRNCPQRDKTGSYYLLMCLFIRMPSSFAAPKGDGIKLSPP